MHTLMTQTNRQTWKCEWDVGVAGVELILCRWGVLPGREVVGGLCAEQDF